MSHSETSMVGAEFCVAPSETRTPVRTGTISGVAPSESCMLSLGISSHISSSNTNLFESVLFYLACLQERIQILFEGPEEDQ